MKGPRGLWPGLVPSLPLLVGFALLMLAFAHSIVLLHDPDTYLHITAGRWIIDHRALPSRDPFSHSMAGAPWTAPEWLAEVVLATIYGAFGWGGLIAATLFCYAGAIAMLTRYLLRHAEPLTTLILVAAAVAVTQAHLLARPHLLALPLLVVWCGEIFAARDAGRRPSFWLLAVMLLWANFHGSFVLGLGLAGYLALESAIWPGREGRMREVQGWGIFVALAIGAAVLTPNGPGGLLEPFRLMRMDVLSTAIVEWLSPNFQDFQPVELWLLGAVLVAFTAGIRLPLARALLLVGLFHMALQHARHAELVGLIGPLAIVGTLGPQLAVIIRSSPPSELARVLARLAEPASWGACMLWLAVGVGICSSILGRPIQRADDISTPSSAVAAAQRMGLTGPVFNSEDLGGYLLFSGVKTFIDGRFEMYGEQFLKIYLKATSGGDPAALAALLENYHIGWTLLDAGSDAAAMMDHMQDWHRVYADDRSVIHVRR